MIDELERMAGEITGYDHISCSPTPAPGRVRRLLAIRATRGPRRRHRDVCLIPSSAHGTNPASAVMAGMKVVVVECDTDGNIDLADLTRQGRASTATLRRS